MLRDLIRMLVEYLTFPARLIANAREVARKADDKTAEQNKLIAEINYDLAHPGHPISSLPPDERERVLREIMEEDAKDIYGNG